MQLRNARNVGHWIRRNLFDGWQVLGTIGLAVGACGFALLLLKAGHALPSTGSTFQLLETLGSEVPMIHATATRNVAQSHVRRCRVRSAVPPTSTNHFSACCVAVPFFH